jgi:hypothetical protein
LSRADNPDKSGFYWVRLKYDIQERDWQPAKFDARTQSWTVLGDNDNFFDYDLEEIGEPCVRRVTQFALWS